MTSLRGARPQPELAWISTVGVDLVSPKLLPLLPAKCDVRPTLGGPGSVAGGGGGADVIRIRPAGGSLQSPSQALLVTALLVETRVRRAPAAGDGADWSEAI